MTENAEPQVVKLNWTVKEEMGQIYINPICFVYETINRNWEKGTVNNSNIGELIKLCFSYIPDRKARVLELMAETFPEYTDQINKYRILL